MSAYRESAPPNELKVEKLRLASEEKRHKRELEMKDRAGRRGHLIEWWQSGDMAKLLTFTTLLLVGGTGCALALMFANHKLDTPERCTESAIVVNVSDSTRRCSGGGSVSTEKLSEREVLVKCTCGGK